MALPSVRSPRPTASQVRDFLSAVLAVFKFPKIYLRVFSRTSSPEACVCLCV